MSELDLVPGMLNSIQKEFKKLFQNDATVKKIYKKKDTTSFDYGDANEFAIAVGELLSESLQKYITADTLPEGRFWYNMASRIMEPTLATNYNLISEICNYAQTNINKNSAVSLQVIKPKINSDRISNYIDKISSDKFEKVQWLLKEPVVNYSQSVVDDSISANCDFQAKSGLSPKIVRTLDAREMRTVMRGKQKVRYSVPCKWCQSLAGTYDYYDMPDYIYDNIFRRHENCRCTVEVIDIGKKTKQDVWSKRIYQLDAEDRINESKTVEKQLSKIETAKKENRQSMWQPAKNTDEAFRYAEEKLGLYITDKKGISLETINMLNKEITKYYETFGDLHSEGVLNGLRVITGKKRYAAAYSAAFGDVILVKSNLTKSGYAKLLEDAIFENQIGFWSTPDREHSIRHELGHAIEKMVANNTEVMKEIESLRNEVMFQCGLTQDIINNDAYTKEQMLLAGSYLSYYALYKNGEFIAEAMAEIMSGNARPIAQKVLEIVLRGLK